MTPTLRNRSRSGRLVGVPAVVLLVAGILIGPSVGVALADAPSDPAGLAQADQSNTPITLGGLIDNGEVHLSATVTDPSSEQVSLQVEVERIGTAFDGTVTATSAPVASGSVASATVTGLADGRYHWQASTIDSNNDIGNWVSFDTNSDGNPADVDFRVNVPTVPTDLAQQDDASQPLATGGLTGSSVTLSATVTDPDYSTVSLEVEAKRIGTAFDGTGTTTSSAVASGSTASVTLMNLDDGRYHWQARAVDGTNAGDWVSFGGNSDGNQPTTNADIDFRVNAPNDPTSLAQKEGSNPIPTGGLTNNNVTLSAIVSDPDGGNLTLEVEAARIGDAFSNTATGTSSPVASGGTASVTITGLADGRYHWQARTVDANSAASRWVSFGGNSDVTPAAIDFRVNAPNDPTGLAQADNNSDPLATGGLTDNPVTLSAKVSDPDSLQVELQVEAERIGVAFTGTPTGTSDPVASGSTASVTLNSLADGRYHWQARTKDENGDTSRWVSFDTNSDGNQPSVNADVDFRVNVPLAPTALAQQDDASQPLPTGGLTDDPVTLSATVTDPDYATLRLEVEAKRIGVAFDGSNTTTSSAVASGSAASVTLTNLDDGRYHWRARAVDQNGATSGWVSSGSNSDGNQPTTNADIDFRVNAPSDPAGLFQQKPNGSAIAVGNNTDGQGGNNKRSVTLGAMTADPDGRDVQLKIQVAQTNKAFSDPGTIEKTSSLAPGGVVSFTFNNGDGLNANQNYHWRARTIDDDGNASRWVPFGGNSDSVTAGTDFRVPQADLSLTKSVLGSSGLTPGDHVNVAASAADLTATHTHTLIVTLGVSNGGPDTAKNVVVTDDVLSIMDNAPAPHQVFDSATYCQLNNPGTSCLSSPVPLPAGGKIAAGDLASGASETFQIFANVSWQVRRGPVTLTNNASAESDVFDPSVATASKNFTVNTIPKFDVQAGNGNAVVSWSPPPLADEAAVNHYRLKITGGPSAITVDPVPTTACTGRNGGTLCYNRTGLTNGTNYTFQLFAVTASSVQRDGSEAQGKPSVDNKAAIVSTTSSSFSTCTTATTKNPICVTMQVPSGGGGVFSVQNAITGYSSFQFTNFCNGSCGLGIGSFEGHPPAGYNNPNNPIQLTVTWDRSAWSGTENSIFYQADSLHGGLPFQLVKCTNQSVDSAFPDPCIKKTNVIGSKNGDNCTLKAACFGDLQAQILLTSAADGGFAKKG